MHVSMCECALYNVCVCVWYFCDRSRWTACWAAWVEGCRRGAARGGGMNPRPRPRPCPRPRHQHSAVPAPPPGTPPRPPNTPPALRCDTNPLYTQTHMHLNQLIHSTFQLPEKTPPIPKLTHTHINSNPQQQTHTNNFQTEMEDLFPESTKNLFALVLRSTVSLFYRYFIWVCCFFSIFWLF